MTLTLRHEVGRREAPRRNHTEVILDAGKSERNPRCQRPRVGSDWLRLLAALDKLHASGTGVLMLSHCKVSTFKNPLGADYDRYTSDIHHKTWAVTSRWADAALFGQFWTETVTAKSNKKEELRKGKGVGGTQRVVYTERRAGFDAKNRYGMPERIDIPDDPKAIWTTMTTTNSAESTATPAIANNRFCSVRLAPPS